MLGLALSLTLGLLNPASAASTRTSAAMEATALPAWLQSVTSEKQRAASDLFLEANHLLKNTAFVPAVEKYRQALTHWDHPAIHYNLALALINIDQPIEAHGQLEAAMRYGAEPLDEEKYEYARTYKTLLEQQLTRLELRCDTPGATVTMDGRILFVAPGHYSELVRPGPHSIIATKTGFLNTDESRTLLPGERLALNLEMCTVEECTRYRRQWSVWMPWTVLGSGVTMVAGGALLHQKTQQDYRNFDLAIFQNCPRGCDKEPLEFRPLHKRGDNLQKAAFGAYALGGAAVVTGAVLIYLNRAQTYFTKPSQHEETVNVSPLLGGDTNGVQATFRF